jgi:diguanylate cyclase
MVVSWVGRRTWKISTFVVGCVVAVVGAAGDTRPQLWPQLVLAGTVAILAQAGAVRFRQANRVVYLGWGEAALIVVAFLLPAGWVPVTMGIGAAIGQGLYRLRTGTPFSWRIAINAGQLTIAALAGTLVAHLIGDDGLASVTMETAAAAVVGAFTYSLVAVSLVNIWFATSVADLARTDARMLMSKAPMVIGSMALGLTFVAMFQHNRDWLLVMPVVLAIMQQAYLYRSRSTDERRIWRDFAEIAQSLNQLDERQVVKAAAAGVQRLFVAAAVEVWVERLVNAPGGFRSTPSAGGDVVTVELAGRPVDYPVAPSAVRALSINGARIGELRVWMPPGSHLELREHMAMSVVGEAIAAALHDASAHRTVRVLAARSLHDAHHDVLTGLPNRATLVRTGDAVVAALTERAVGAPHLALLLFGIDRFKDVNDTLGHRGGDELLRLTAARLIEFSGPGEYVARLTGDKFVLLTSALDGRHPKDSALATAQKLADQLAAPAEIAGIQLAAEVSIGIAYAPIGSCDTDELLRRADIAMYRAKRGSVTCAVYGDDEADVAAGSVERLSVVLDLREAITRSDQLVIDVLPTLDLDTGQPLGGEALIRWHHPRRGLLGPAEFVDIVDTSDLVVPFTRYVLERALALAGTWAADGLPLPVSVNLSPRSLADPDLPDDVEVMLSRYGIPASMLILDITESAVIAGQAVADDVLTRLRRLGVQIAVDDFGTGYSSLTFLARGQIDEVKLDSSFVNAMVSSPEAAAIVRTTVDLGRRLGVRVVAEGVESAAQRTALRELGCPSGQGRHLVAPISADLTGTAFRQLAATAAPDRLFPPL